MFKLGYLISTGACIDKIEKDWITADVVMGDVNLIKGERLIILDYLFHPLYKDSIVNCLNYNVGVIQVGNVSLMGEITLNEIQIYIYKPPNQRRA